MWPIFSNPSRYVVPFHPFTHPFACPTFSFHSYMFLALLCLSARSPPILSLSPFGYLLVTLPCRTRAAPGLLARTRSRASPSSRTRTRAGHVIIRAGCRLYTMGPAHAHASAPHLGPPAKLNHVPSAPHAASPASPAPLNGTLSSHAMTACAHPQAVAARREPTMTARSQPARSAPGLALHAPASRTPHRARPPQTPLAPPALRCHRIPCDREMHTPRPPAASARIALPNHAHTRPRHRNGPTPKGANDLSLLGHHSLGSVVDPPLQGHLALQHRGILRCSVQIRCQTNYISPSMRSQQVQVGPGR